MTELSDSNLEEFLQDYSIVEARVIARSDEDYQFVICFATLVRLI